MSTAIAGRGTLIYWAALALAGVVWSEVMVAVLMMGIEIVSEKGLATVAVNCTLKGPSPDAMSPIAQVAVRVPLS